VCSIFFAYDVGLAIDLAEAQARIAAANRPGVTRHRRRGPVNYGYHSPPVRVKESVPAVPIGGFSTCPEVEFAIFDFGAVSVSYSLHFECPLEELLDLSDLLYENPSLLADSRSRVQMLVDTLRTAIKKSAISPFVEDYVLYEMENFGAGAPPTGAAPGGTTSSDTRAAQQPVMDALLEHAPLVARVLRGERGGLAPQEVEDAMSCRIAFAPSDAALIDWNASLLVGSDMDDVRAVLEYANVELLEMRYLDDRLDRALDQSYLGPIDAGPRRLLSGGSATELRGLAELQADSALLFEGVNNALKLLGDQYLARVYRLISRRLHLPEWDASILRKLGTLESIYQKRNDFQTSRRLETLEWIVIILIAVEVVLSILSHLWK
jgi:hypothetical protein